MNPTEGYLGSLMDGFYKDSRISLKNNHQPLIVVLLYESPEGYLGSRMDGFYKDSRISLKTTINQ
jgi:hypothetical protein